MTSDILYLELVATTPEKIENIKNILKSIGVKVLNIFKTGQLEEQMISQFTIDEFWFEIEEGYKEIERGEYLTQKQLDREVEKLWK